MEFFKGHSWVDCSLFSYQIFYNNYNKIVSTCNTSRYDATNLSFLLAKDRPDFQYKHLKMN